MFCLACTPASALTITSEAPNNIFIEGKPAVFEIKDARGDVSYEVTDYFGKVITGTTGPNFKLCDLKPGWYQLKCKDSDSEASISMGVVIDRKNAPLPKDGRVCVDVAAAWVTKPENYPALVKMIKLAGIPWVRERLSWGGTEYERGKFKWTHYKNLYDMYADEGINICLHWGDVPKWTTASGSGATIEDLRDYYNYACAVSRYFSHQVQAWEIGNEPDLGIPFDRYAGIVKTAYLGLKDGNPKAPVLIGSIARGATNYTDGLYESGVTDYFDIFNWHIYAPPQVYAGALGPQFVQLAHYGADTRPVWKTEAGVVVIGNNEKLLDEANWKTQCRYIPRGYILSFAAGDEKNFFFLLLSYMEHTTQFGLLKPDLTPNPAFVALSAAANIIGQSVYKGKYDSKNSLVDSHVFSTPKGNVLAAWSDKETDIIVPTEKKTVRMADIFGGESTLNCNDGYVTVKVGPEAVYLLDIGKQVETRLTGKARPTGKLPDLHPSHIVLAAHSNQTYLKESDSYDLADRSAFDYTIDVYNFDDKKMAEGCVELTVPEGWIIDNAKQPVKLEKMGRKTLIFKITPGEPKAGIYKLIGRAEFAKEKVSPSVSAFTFNTADIKPVESLALDWAGDSTRWEVETSNDCALKLSNPEPNTLHYDVTFTGRGDRWLYPILQFNKTLDFSDYDGIAFDLNVPEEKSGIFRLMIIETSGAHYIASTIPAAGKKHVVFFFRNLERLDHMGADPNGRFDPDSVAKIKFGCNASREKFTFDISNFELVKF